MAKATQRRRNSHWNAWNWGRALRERGCFVRRVGEGGRDSISGRDWAVHPGEWLRAEVIEPAGLNVIEAAEWLRVTRQACTAKTPRLLGTRFLLATP